MTRLFTFSSAIIGVTASAFVSSAAFANELRQLQEELVRTAYACGEGTQWLQY